MTELGRTGRFVSVTETAERHHVFFVRDDVPGWWQLVATFRTQDRAESYAEVENDLHGDGMDQEDIEEEPPTLSLPPPSGPMPETPQPETPQPEVNRFEDWYRTAADKVLDSIKALGPRATNEAIAKHSGVASVPRALRDLMAEGRLKRRGSARGRRLLAEGEKGFDDDRPEPPRGSKPGRHHRMPQMRDPTEGVYALAKDHQANLEGRTLFPSSVSSMLESPRALVSGKNSAKIGDRVTRGPWAGLPIYTLTLEERATCPRTCHHWLTCYGNSMPRARRHVHGSALERRLDQELAAKSVQHPQGYVVRLHVLGDFYSVEYVQKWHGWLIEHPRLHVFGYTAWQDDSVIGNTIRQVREKFPERFAIRTSAAESLPMGATTIWRLDRGRVLEGIVCPAQSGDTECCGSCGLCWSDRLKDDTIVFIAHGKADMNGVTEAAAE